MITGKGFALFVLAAALGFGQSFQGGVRGRIQDPTGSAVATAKITLKDTGTGVSRSTLTNDQGEYVFNAVNPASYSLSAESPGFKVASRSVTVSTQTFLTVDVSMEVGNVTESVNVTEEVPLMETANASTGQVVDRQKLVDLPNLGRNPFMMSKIAQNVTPVGNPIYNRMQDQSGSSQISIAGGPVRGNNYLLDGIPITDSVNRAVIIPTIESVQEVKIQANTYDAEMGRTGGGVFNTYMKSGTNSLHGSGFGYMRQTDWAANSFFNNRGGLPRAEVPFRNYGGSIGGPVWIPKLYDGRNKTFFWIGAEAYRQTSALGSEFAVPSALERTGDFSQSLSRTGAVPVIYDPLTTRTDGTATRTPFAGSLIPASRIDAVGRAIAATYPLPTRSAAFLGANNYSASASLRDRADQMTFKADHEIRPWWRVNASYLHYGSREPGENWFGGSTGPSSWLLGRKVDATQVNSTLTPSATSVVTVRYGFNRFPNASTQRSMGYDLASMGFSPAFVSAVQSPTFPNVAMETFASLGTNSNSFSVFHSKNFLVSASKFMGRHSLKAGYDFRSINIDGIDFSDNSGAFTFNDVFTRANPNSATAGTGSDLASMLLGYASSGTGILASKLYQNVRYNAVYFQDDFRMNPKLTLNFGVRYEYETGLRGAGNALITGFDRNLTSPIPVTLAGATAPKGALMYAGLNGANTETGNNNHNKFSPRIGAAYALDDKTTLRGGYGLFWAPIPYGLQNTLGYSQTTALVSSNNGNLTPSTSLSNPFPSGLLPIVGNAAGALAGIGQSVSFIDQFHRSPRVHQYSFDIQRQLPGGLTLLAGYIGTTSRQMVLGVGGININQLDPALFAQGPSLLQTVANPFYRAGGPGFIGSANITRAQALKPFPQFSNVTLNFSDQNYGRYDAFVFKAQKRMAKGLSFVTTWTYSKNMDASWAGPGNNLNGSGTIQNAYDVKAEYGLAAVDATNRWSSAFTYELPFGKGRSLLANNRALDLIAGGWSVNAISVYQSGFPLAITQQSNNNSVLGAGGQRPNATGVDPTGAGNFAQRLDGWINPAAFSQAPQYTFGNVSRTIGLRGPGQASWDLSIFKTFSVMEGVKAQFRAEALNAFNTPLFRSPTAAFGNANFGRVTSQANFPRLIQLGVRFFL